MIHTLQSALTHALSGLVAHMSHWDGWAVLIASMLFGFRAEPLWMPAAMALIINPTLYGLISGLIRRPSIGLDGVLSLTLYQVIVAYLGYFAGRLVKRFR